ncbi:adenylate/guanylate cyclase domain-containing protein [Treponema parvum]|uniref:Adenylate/guanylate cyclase domain-containing protein n=1 Tax=Treponema parvum TaxID=138851 RepID=A0A975IBX1_9SPIR|nr:adenylate/guanylate cyclase domain-containing protein [Treponema parvum]QTQ11157.1 adenylate/guanylate cyclase domain-containing protein [Treponema parvum]QTQ16902.1 adenylate/guanylate cyclase domain-containing protein [Treponema parvum]
MSEDLISELGLGTSKSDTIELDLLTMEALRKGPIDIFDNVYLGETRPDSLILCIDVRGFSDFMCNNEETVVFGLIKSFTSNFLSCLNQFGYNCSYYKLLGDGALVIWDKLDGVAIKEAITVFAAYIEFANEELFKSYRDLSIGGALVLDKVYKYEISAEASQLKYRDYVGYGINLACRLQNLAAGGELIVSKKLVDIGAIYAKKNTNPDSIKKLKALKGLKEDDREGIYLYQDINPKILSKFKDLNLDP